MDCSGSMAVDAGGTAVGGRGACAWIWLAGAGGGTGMSPEDLIVYQELLKKL